jgi:hypothetical protein
VLRYKMYNLIFFIISVNLLVANRMDIAKVRDMCIKLVSMAEGTGYVANNEHLLDNQPNKDIYKMWMDKLPIKIWDDLIEFEEMLKNNEKVLEALVRQNSTAY